MQEEIASRVEVDQATVSRVCRSSDLTATRGPYHPAADPAFFETIIFEVLTGRLSKRKHEQVMQQARSGRLRVIVATQVADEGLDLPELDRLFLATPCRSTAKVQQRIGRVMRPAEGKQDAVVYDFVDSQVGMLASQAKSRCYNVYSRLAG